MSKNGVKIPPGVYAANLVSIKPGRDPLQIVCTFELLEPEPEATKFYVFHKPSRTYTAIGAKNIHHAANKVTKLYGGNWTAISRESPSANSPYKFYGVTKWGEIIKSAL